MNLRLFACFVALLVAAWAAPAGPGGIAGAIHGPEGRPLPGAWVEIQSESSGARWRTQADALGDYALPGLPPGRYRIRVHLSGFRTVARLGETVTAASGLTLDFALEMISLHEVITVESGRDEVDPSNGDSLRLRREGPGAALPANGRDFRVAFDLLPGIVVTPAVVSDAGQFTANGQRPNANTFRVDGLSANTGVGGSVLPGSLPGASLPAMNAIGSTETLVSPETAQSVELRASSFAPEFGERPGAEASIVTRGGTNEFHGSMFGDVRDNGWFARDWFANSRGLAYPRPYYRRIGGVVGGPVWRNRTFFLFSAEHSKLRDTGLQLSTVPSMEIREIKNLQVGEILRWFPPPTGRDFGNGLAEGVVALGRTGNYAGYSLRLDHTFGPRTTAFVRVNRAPSSSVSTQMAANQGDFTWTAVSAGLTRQIGAGSMLDVRGNYSRAHFFSTFTGNPWNWAFDLAGLGPADLSGLAGQLPAGTDPGTVAFALTVPGLGQFVSGEYGGAGQDQWEGRISFGTGRGPHQLRFGTDAIVLNAYRGGSIHSYLGVAESLESLLAGAPLPMTFSETPARAPRIYLYSSFAQDTWRVNSRLSVIYGFRWEVTPPPPRRGSLPTVSGIWDGSTWQTTYTGDLNSNAAPWPMRWGQIAPRAGLAYRLVRGVVLRAGGGLFYETRLGSAISPINGAPFNSWLLASRHAGSAPATPSRPGQSFVAKPQPADPAPLELPSSMQWRLALEAGSESRGLLSVAYIGAAGRHLLGNEAYVDKASGVLNRFVTLTRNNSSYHGLQARFGGNLGRRWYASAAYTWSHSIDDGSLDSSVFLASPGYSLRSTRASSSFDVRHTFSTAVSHRWRGWTISGIARVRGGFPIDILRSQDSLGRGFENTGRPDLVGGVPLWLNDPTVAGGRRINPDAFADPAPGREGNLGRNALRGNGLGQVDLSIRRDLPVGERFGVQVQVNVFNVANRPSFADPVPYLSSPWFGQPTSMQNLMLGGGTPNNGLPALFQSGGARSAELTLRLSF